MAENWSDILAGLGAEVAAGATPAALGRLERTAGASLPDGLRGLLEFSDGADVPAPWLRLLSAAEIEQYGPTMRAVDPDGNFGLTAFAEADDSNPFCLYAQGPLADYVVRVNHDGDPEVAFRSLPNFFRALKSLAAGAEPDDVWIDDLPYEIGDDRGTRTDDDVRRGIELLGAAEPFRGNDARLYMVLMALQLLTDRQVDVIARLLDDEWFVRRAARGNLRRFDTPEARRALQRDEEEMRSFAARVVAAMREAGLDASEAEPAGQLRIEPGPVQMHLEGAFAERSNPATIPGLIENATRWSRERQGSGPSRQ